MAVPGDAVKPLPAWHDGAVEQDAVAAATSALQRHGLVGLPTETVYGLAALASDPAAVRRVFEVKGRPADHPVIVHVASAAAFAEWGADPPSYALELAEALWPGPLTLVIPAAPTVPRYVTGGQDTVGLRCPAHPVALAVVEAAGPVAAPSANRFGQVSPTSAADVLADIGDRLQPGLDLILDGGACPVGVESTILDCTGDAPRVLRWGAVEPADVQRVTGLLVSHGRVGRSSTRRAGFPLRPRGPRAPERRTLCGGRTARPCRRGDPTRCRTTGGTGNDSRVRRGALPGAAGRGRRRAHGPVGDWSG